MMADHTSIEWTDATWNPITGCAVVSPGCTNCYAMRLAGTRLQHHPSRAGLTRDSKAGPVWTGETRLNEAWLTQPLRWKRPRRIFVCAHGDLFAESVPDAWIDRVFAVMALAPQHIFQVLTKRARRMREYMAHSRRPYAIARATMDFVIASPAQFGPLMASETWPVASEGDIDDPSDILIKSWPLPNAWLGVSAEDQTRADERVPELLETPAAVRWVSAEPLLGEIDFTEISTAASLEERFALHDDLTDALDALSGFILAGGKGKSPCLDWVVVGGESGPDARPMHPDWARSIRDQCAVTGVPFFFTQWGEWAPCIGLSVTHRWRPDGSFAPFDGGRIYSPGMARLSKRRAGRLLDGLAHDAMPEAR